MDGATHALASGFLVGGGRFTLLRQLGTGGMSVVWLAHDERLNESVALKFLSDAIRNDTVALNDLRLETQKSRKLTHPNIIRIYDLYEAPGEAAFFSMEYIDGPTLHELKHQQLKGFFGWTYLRPLVKQLCDAMDYAHNEGVIHRDLKPANMMVDKRDRLKLADFGIASVGNSTGRHQMSGTPTYMSPQQMDGKPPQVSDDIYALGATLYELLCGQPPFYEGDIAEQVRNQPAMPLAERLAQMGLRGDAPPDVAAMIMACLSKDPEKRPHSARLVAEWIGLTGSTVAPTVIKESVEPVAPTTETPVPEEPVPQPDFAPPSRKMGVVMVLSCALILCAAGLFAWQKFGKKDQAQTAIEPPVETWTNTTAFNPAPVPLPPAIETSKPDPSPPAIQTKSLIDPGFKIGSGCDHDIKSIIVQPDGKILVAGTFLQFNDADHHAFTRFNADGSFDNSSQPSVEGEIYAMALQPDGKILLGGDFSSINGVRRRSIARLNRDLTLDTSFDAEDGPGKEIRTLIYNHGKIVAGGSFARFNGVKASRIVQLDSSGHVDASFAAAEGPNGRIWGAAAQADGLILIGGEFKKVGAKKQEHLARLNSLGQVDPYFLPRLDSLVYVVAIQPDRRILIGGAFRHVNGSSHRAFARLNPDGSLDHTFAPAIEGNSSPAIEAIALQSDGKIVIGGVFTSVNGVNQNHLARLNRDGTLDRSFAPNLSGVVVRAVAAGRDGRVLAGGYFDTVDDLPRKSFVVFKDHAPGR